MDSALNILKKYWNYDTFLKPQEEIIQSVIDNHDVMALLPTGAGKSICFQVPAMMKEGICIVISPLIALMEDQVKSLSEKGIKAVALTSGVSFTETINTFDNLKYGNYKFLYLSPEKLQSELILEKISELKVNLVAVDEAHCISEWGHDFRPSYLKIKVLYDIFPDVKFIALTATATSRVVDDIVKNLELEKPKIFRGSFYKKNLSYQIFKTEDLLVKLTLLLKEYPGSCIVYVSTRKLAFQISNFLNKQGFKAGYYHGGLSFEEKNTAYTDWIEDTKPVMVATNAFGMGIDKASVRKVIHMNIPQSMENYVQETGRAGRDGDLSFAFLLYNEHTIYEFENTLHKGMATPEICKTVLTSLNKYFQIANGELPEKYFDISLHEFCLHSKLPVVSTFNVLVTLENEGVLEFKQQIRQRSVVKFIAPGEVIITYQHRNPGLKPVIQALLRNYGGIHEQFTAINEFQLAKKLQIKRTKLISELERLQTDHMILYKRYKGLAQLKFLVPREDQYTMNRIKREISQRNRLKIKKADAIVDYIRNDTVCRSVQIRKYFGESGHLNTCNLCDVCRKGTVKDTNPEVLAEEILKLIRSVGSLSSRDLQQQLKADETILLKTLSFLLEKGTLALNSQNKFNIV